MIKEVDVDGDGRIDFYGKISFALYYSFSRKENAVINTVKTKISIFILEHDSSIKWSMDLYLK